MTVDEIHAEQGGHPLTDEEFQEYFGDLPSDGEGQRLPTSRRGARVAAHKRPHGRYPDQ
jgi:hypothetical protein